MESRKEIKPEVMILYAAYCTMAAKSLMMVADFTEQKKEEKKLREKRTVLQKGKITAWQCEGLISPH